MTNACLLLLVVGFTVALPATALVRALSRRARAFDTPPLPGQIKAPSRRIPNTGGIAIFLGFSLPLAAALVLVHVAPSLITAIAPAAERHLPGIRDQTSLAVTVLACISMLHLLGLIDDRRPLGPFLKLGIMALPAIAIATYGGTRVLTLLDHYVGGPWLSVLVTVFWFLVVTNALNFMDNMDGLSAGVAAVAGGFFLASAIMHGQWFVAACDALLLGSLLGFLVFNFPPASIFMGDGGSLVIGFLLAFLTARTTFFRAQAPGVFTNWYGVLTPLIVLAVPIYDFLSVTLIRLSKGRSPFVGDLNHISHRLVRRGLSRRAAVAVIYGFTAITGFSGLILGSVPSWGAVLVAIQVLVLLLVVALFEFAANPPSTSEPR